MLNIMRGQRANIREKVVKVNSGIEKTIDTNFMRKVKKVKR